ncbi:hypothetical protein [Aquiflexum sp.]|uniref:hypothetical protein n=1 Tax=Aquiflexum sp. TaxID=1872584 RepID=UPI003593E93F
MNKKINSPRKMGILTKMPQLDNDLFKIKNKPRPITIRPKAEIFSNWDVSFVSLVSKASVFIIL